MKHRPLLTALTLAAALLPAASAAAHVTVVPRTAAAGSYTVFDVRVPNERDDAATVKIDIKLPDGFITASYEPIPGWQVRVIREQLTRPIETENGPIAEQVSRVVWTSTGAGIPPGAFQDFPLSVKLPDQQGETLSFKALQTYRGGEVVRWIGAPDSELPAATVELTAAEGEGDGAGAGHSGGEDADEQPAATTPADAATSTGQPAAAADDGGDDGASKGLAYAGLGAGIVGLLLGGAALAVAGRRREPAGGAPAEPTDLQ